MANSSIILSNLDFARLKNTFKQYLRSQDKFKDYDFDGSNMSVLLDVMTYNTYMNSFYLNMIGNEMFMDTATMRDTVVSHAKELNYTPQSFTSAVATVNLQVVTNDPEDRSVAVPKGTSFTSKFNDKSYTFVTDQNIVMTNKTAVSGSTSTFLETGVKIYEGLYASDSYTTVPGTNQRYLISNRSVDVSSINVTVIEDLGATTLSYKRAASLYDLTEESKVYFVQGAENDKYEIVFGDGVIGRKPKDNSIVLIEYRTGNGELPNGCNVFKPNGQIGGSSNITVTTVTKAAGGSISESLESIKFNAPRAFTTQERAVTTEDFENLLKTNFPEINAVSAYGGEQLNPPQFGRVFVAVDLKETDLLPTSKMEEYYRFLKPRSVVSIEPIFVNPDYVYINVISSIKYNINTSALNTSDVSLLATSAIIRYANDKLNNFNRTLRYSKLVEAIDSSSSGIVGNETEVTAVKYLVPEIGTARNYQLNFGMPFKVRVDSIVGDHAIAEEHIIATTAFTYNDQRVYIEDDGNGNLEYIALGGTSASGEHQVVGKAGTVDYENGVVYLNGFKISDYEGDKMKIYAKPRSRDISSSKDIILNISEEDIVLTVTPIRE